MTATVLSAKSLADLQAVHADLVAVVQRTLELCSRALAVDAGIRRLEERKRLLAAGARQALNSRHLSGHAMDTVPRINGKRRREWTPIHHIADAVRQAANAPGKPII